VLFDWVFEWRRHRSSQNVPRQPYPSGFIASNMKFKLHGRAIRPAEYPEQVECFQFDPSQIAVMCFSHTSSTFELMKKRLQNGARFVARGKGSQRDRRYLPLGGSSRAATGGRRANQKSKFKMPGPGWSQKSAP
jgi:hypothetical protein